MFILYTDLIEVAIRPYQSSFSTIMTYRLCLIFAALCFISNYLLSASGAGTHVYDADKATDQSKTSSRESFGKKKEEVRIYKQAAEVTECE